MNNIVEGLIIAAGKSTRTGNKHKMTLDLVGKTVLQRSIDSMLPFCRKIIVVTGFNSEKISETIKNYPKLKIIYNNNYEEGMFSSLKAGLEYIEAEQFFFLPGDCPFVSHVVYKKMLKQHSEIILPLYKGSAGHPVLFRHSVKEKILNNNYNNLREFIYDNKPEFVEVECEGILWDIDTLEDYQKSIKIFQRKGW